MPKTPLLLLSLAVPCCLSTYNYIELDEGSFGPYRSSMMVADESASPTFLASDRSHDYSKSQTFRQLADSLCTDKIRTGTSTFNVLHSVFVEWGANDPFSAMAYLEQTPQGIQLFSKAVLRGWSQGGNVQNAIAWIESEISPPLATPFYEAVIDGLSDVGRNQDTLDLALRSNSNVQASLARHAIQKWTARNLPTATRWIERNVTSFSPPIQESVLSGYASTWAEESPRAASEWARTTSSDSGNATILQAAVDRWIQKDPTAAGYWIFSQKKDEDIEQVLSETAHQIAHVDPQAAFEFIENDPANHEDPYRMRGHLIMALDTIIRKAPSTAAPWIKRVEAQALAAVSEGLIGIDYKVPQSTYVEMFNRWAAEDEDAALAYLKNASQIDEAQRSEIERTAIDRLQTDNPEKAAYYLYKRWKDADQMAAVEFAEANSREHLYDAVSNFKSHYQTVAKTWAQTDPERVCFYLERQEVLDPEETAKLLVTIHPLEL